MLPLAFTGAASMKRSGTISQIPSPTKKAVHDTVEGCRDMAAADLARAALCDTANGRRRLESSAQSWVSRAELIQGLEEGAETRQAQAKAEWAEGEEASKWLAGRGDDNRP